MQCIENPDLCEVCSVIRFLNARKTKPIDIHRQLTEVYGEDVMSEGKVRKWCRDFNGGRTNVHDEERVGRPTVVTDDIKTRVDQHIRKNRRFTLDELHITFPDVSRTSLHKIVSEELQYSKICARWVPRMLSDLHKQQRMAAALTFLQQYHDNGDQFLNSIITGDETWICHYTPETKRQSLEWHHSYSPTKPRKFKQTHSAMKLMATVFWDREGLLLVEFLPRGQTINSEAYCMTLLRLRRAIQNKRRGKLTKGITLIHDNARPHVSNRTTSVLANFGWNVFEHPPYSPDLAPSDYHLFTLLKQSLGGRRFQTDEEVMGHVNRWLKNLAASVYEEGIQKLVPRYDKCLNLQGDYVEK